MMASALQLTCCVALCEAALFPAHICTTNSSIQKNTVAVFFCCTHTHTHALCRSLFSSPLKRARTTSEVIWQGRAGSCIYTESLAEAPLGWLQGMTNGTAPVQSHHQAWPALCLCKPATWLQLVPRLKLVVEVGGLICVRF